MSGAGFILAINIFVAALLATAFLTVAAFDRERVAARWLGAAFLAGMPTMLIEFGISTFGTAPAAVIAAFASILGAMLLFNVGVARNYGVPVPWLSMGLVFAVSVVTSHFIQDMPRDSFMRLFLYQTPYSIMQAVAVVIVARGGSRSRLDIALMVLLALSALQFLSKPFLYHALGGGGATPRDYLGTDYAMVSQSMGTIFALAIALLMLAILVRDVLDDATARSEIDPLSGLLNRAGFEARSRDAQRRAGGSAQPVSLLVADLDHFKSINDTLGHAAGDRVIAAFAAFLKSALSERHVAGRIGGEEFAVLLPGTNLVAAKLFAEGARAAWSSSEVEGIPEHRQLTVSIGLAELAPGEDVTGLFVRADKALYAAKNSGRDCVKIAPRPDVDKTSGGAAVRL